jgi:hypothetical protein
MAGATNWGSEFLVNTTTAGAQFAPSVIKLANGRFMVAWVDNSLTDGDTSGDAVKAQVFNADGTKSGGEFLVNTTTTSHQLQPVLTAQADGDVVAAWSDQSATGGDISGWAIRAQILGPDGTKSGAELLVDTTTANIQRDPAITTLTNGGFAVAWSDQSLSAGDHTSDDVRARVYSANGTPLAVDFLVNTTTASNQDEPAIAGLANSKFAVVWTDFSSSGGDTSSTAIRGQIFNSDGSKSGAEFLANTTTASTQEHPAIAALTDGRFVVSWDDSSTSGTTGIEVRAQVFNADGSKSGAEFVVNSTHTGDQLQSAVTALANGRFAITWEDSSQTDGDASGRARRAQVFNAATSKSGAEFLVNTTTLNDQTNATITELVDGRIVIAWSDASQTAPDINGLGVRAQIFDPRESEIYLHGTPLADDVIGTPFGDVFFGSPGADRINGGGGDDAVSYEASSAGVVVNLLAGHASGGDAQGDTLINIRNVYGSDYDDVLVGDAQDNILWGGKGHNTLDGGAGYNTAQYGHAFTDYRVMDFGSKIIVLGADSTDTLLHIDALQFGAGNALPIVREGAPEFDRMFYLSSNADVFNAGVDAMQHYNQFGWHEGRDPNPGFDTSAYLAVNKDVAAAGVNPLEHYEQQGWKEGRDPGPNFDTKLYLLHNPDVAAAGIDPLGHYLQFGFSEGRQAYQAIGQAVNGFDAEYYLMHNPDVAAAGVDALTHYNTFGWHEGRAPNAWFDSAGYLAHYTDVAAAGVNPLAHYMQSGWLEGRDPSATFDTHGYLAANPDVAAAHINPLQHFLDFGIYEGRTPVNDGVWA